jgi:rhamnose transport system permease protein
MKNHQVAILSAAMLISALIVAGSNKQVADRLAAVQAACGTAACPMMAGAPLPAADKAPKPTGGQQFTVAMMPKNKGDAYFISCKEGAEAAAKELGIKLLWDGPTQTDPMKQNEVVEAWITQGVNVIAVSVENKEAIATVLRKAKAKGIKVLTWDADSEQDARDFLINQATPQGIGETLMDEAARIMGGEGEFAIVTASLTAANQNDWIKFIKARLAAKHPKIKLATIEPSDDQRDKAFSRTQALLKAYPKVKLVMAIAAPAVPGAAEAVDQSGRKDVKVMGLSLPNLCKEFIHKGVIDCIVLWNTLDLGYLTVHAAQALADGKLAAGATALEAGKLGKIEVAGDEVLLGKPFVFNKANVDKFNF